MWPQAMCDGRHNRHLSTRSHHGTFQVGFSEEPDPALTLWEVSTGTTHACGQGRRVHMTGYLYTQFQLNFYSSPWISIKKAHS